MLHIRKNDTVTVIGGKNRGRRGKVLRILPKTNRAVVEGINMVKRHTRPNPQRNVKGGIVEREAPIHLSNLQLINPQSDKPTRVGYKMLADGRKVRVCRKTGETID